MRSARGVKATVFVIEASYVYHSDNDQNLLPLGLLAIMTFRDRVLWVSIAVTLVTPATVLQKCLDASSSSIVTIVVRLSLSHRGLRANDVEK